MLLLAVILFLITLFLVIWQPRGLNIGWPAGGGALIALLCGVVDGQDVLDVTHIVWNATLTLVGIILISLVLDEIGFFEWAALHVARASRGNGRRMFVYVVLLGAGVAIFFANDGAVLILTPIVLSMVRALKLDERFVLPFIMACGFISDTASLPFTVSNLVNIVSSDFFHVGFAEYTGRMIVPTLVSVAASLLVLYLYYRNSIPADFEAAQLPAPADAIKNPKLFKVAWAILAVLFLAYFSSGLTGIPVSAISGTAAAILLLLAHRGGGVDTRKLIKGAPWSIVVFSVGMYVVVYGLRNAGLTAELGRAFQWLGEQGLLAATVGSGFIAALLSSAMNNLPTVMINALAIDGTHPTGLLREAFLYANVIGSDLGPKITPIGSLATLLWLHVLSGKGVRISWGTYFKTGLVLTVPVLLATLLGLYAWLRIIG
ncbi:arsenic transporter [Gorillibacterium sp. sgz500922]|uniref:arsenic transporter n=1 Tax=Gorillibacterium sp. sgz500922 TaxID=3446694 RepID=UPI003F66C09A